jgi:hypothetical protein
LLDSLDLEAETLDLATIIDQGIGTRALSLENTVVNFLPTELRLHRGRDLHVRLPEIVSVSNDFDYLEALGLG